MFMTALAALLLGARLYRFDICVTSRYFVADPWLADLASGGGTRFGMGSFKEGAVAGFSTTVPNCSKAVWLRSSMGIRIDGAGIEDGIFAVEVEKRDGREDGSVELGWSSAREL
jgi:hypothetical protein